MRDPEFILDVYREKWTVYNRNGQPKRPPNAYILCRSWAGMEAVEGWKTMPPSERLFWENAAEMLAKEHKLFFPDYTYQPVGRSKKAKDLLLHQTMAFRARYRQRNSYESSDGISASGLEIVHEGMDSDVVSGPITSDLATVDLVSDPAQASDLLESTSTKTCGKSRQTPDRQGRPKAPLNAFIVFKTVSRYGTHEASHIWRSLTAKEKRWWHQVASLAKEDLRRVTLAIDDIRDTMHGAGSILERPTLPYPEQEWSSPIASVQGSDRELTVPTCTECVPLCTNHSFEDSFNGYRWEPPLMSPYTGASASASVLPLSANEASFDGYPWGSTTFQDHLFNTDPDMPGPDVDWFTIINFNPEPAHFWNELSTGPSPLGRLSPLDLGIGLPAASSYTRSMAQAGTSGAADSGSSSVDAPMDFSRSILGVPKWF
jgi:hypothetical protein